MRGGSVHPSPERPFRSWERASERASERERETVRVKSIKCFSAYGRVVADLRLEPRMILRKRSCRETNHFPESREPHPDPLAAAESGRPRVSRRRIGGARIEASRRVASPHLTSSRLVSPRPAFSSQISSRCKKRAFVFVLDGRKKPCRRSTVILLCRKHISCLPRRSRFPFSFSR